MSWASSFEGSILCQDGPDMSSAEYTPVYSSLVSQHRDRLQNWPQANRKVQASPWSGTLVQMRHKGKRQPPGCGGRLCRSGVSGPGEPPHLHHLGKACWWEWDRKSASTSSFPGVTWSWKSYCCSMGSGASCTCPNACEGLAVHAL